jgi:hypothetical protein
VRDSNTRHTSAYGNAERVPDSYFHSYGNSTRPNPDSNAGDPGTYAEPKFDAGGAGPQPVDAHASADGC